MNHASGRRLLVRLAGVTVLEAEVALERIGSDVAAVDLRPNGYLLDLVLHASGDGSEDLLRLALEAFGPSVYTLGAKPLAAVLLDQMRERRLTISAAESCTGGWVGAALTSPPGASDVFWGGIVAYDDAAKRRLLGVQEATLARYGAVSEEVAIEMASGVRGISGTTWAVAVTGIAGPSGGTSDKPVGSVWIATAGPLERTRLFNFSGGRRGIRRRSTQAALDMLRLATRPEGD